MFLAVMCSPLDCVLSATNKLPISIGSIDGMSSSGIPAISDGRSFSMLVIIHCSNSGSLCWQMCKYEAENTKKRQRLMKKIEKFFVHCHCAIEFKAKFKQLFERHRK